MRAARIAASAALLLSITSGSLPALTTTASADAGTLYVGGANCSDTAAAAGSQTTPFCTIQAAVAVVQPGQTVRVATGTYSGEVDITRSGTANAPITIEGIGAVGQPQTVLNSTGTAFRLSGVHNVVIRSFLTQSPGAAVTVTDSSDVVVDGNQLYGASSATTGVLLNGTTHRVTLSRNQVYGFGAGAVYLSPGTSDNTLTTNFIYNTAPVVVADGAPGTVITSNTVRTDASHLGIELTGGSSGSTVENNVVSPTTSTACTSGSACSPEIEVSADSVPGSKLDYNIVDPSAGSAAYSWAGTAYTRPSDLTAATGQGAHDLIGPVTENLREGSPAIDSADAAAPGELSTDVWGKPRVNDPLVADTGTGSGYVDRGAVEFQDPYRPGSVSLNYMRAPVGTTIIATDTVVNPWSDPISSYTFHFGDGSAPVTSDKPYASHVYTTVPMNPTYTVWATVQRADGSTAQAGGVGAQPTEPMKLKASVSSDVSNADTPLAMYITVGGSSSWDFTKATLDFGDGSAEWRGTGPGIILHTFPKAGTYTVSDTVTNVTGATASSTSSVTVGSSFVPVTPTRILDTRSPGSAKVGPGGTVSLQITGAHGVPASGVTAVVLNVTATDATEAGFVTAYPSGTSRPTASNLNITPGATVPASVTVPVGTDGKVTLYNHAGSTDLIADLQGYYQASPSVSGGTTLVGASQRILDTRYGTGAPKAKIGAGQTVTFTLPGSVTQEQSVKAVLLNLTATDATEASYVSAYPAGSSRPIASVLNFRPGQNVSNLAVVPVSAGNQVTLYNHAGSTDLIADVQGVYDSSGWGSVLTPASPTRILDTRSGGVKLGPGQTLKLVLPSALAHTPNLESVLLNLTVTNGTAGSYLTAYPGGQARPSTSNVNFAAGQTLADATSVGVGPGGTVDIYNHAGYVDVIVDLQGYFTY